MRGRGCMIALCTLAALLVVSCAPSPSGGGRDAGASSPARRPKQLTVGILQEPSGWAPWGATTSAGGTLQPPSFIERTLSQIDDKGEPRAELAVVMPVLGSSDWTVNADGSMDQTWQIQPNARWHDGQPVTA